MLLIILLELFLLLFAKPVLSAIQPDTEIIILHVMNLISTDVRTVSGKADNALITKFKELHPDVRIEGAKGIYLPSASGSEILLAMAGGIAPEILYVNFRMSETYISQGFLQPLDEYVEKWQRENPEEFRKVIHPALLPVIKREEHIWAIPWGGAMAMGLIYRKDLFKEAGLPPDKPPKNWDELYEYSKKLTIPERGQYGFGLFAGPESAWHYVNFLWSAGGEVLIEDGKGNWRAVFNSPEAVLSLEFYRKLVRGKWKGGNREYTGVAYRGRDLYTMWEEGKIGMLFNYLEEQVMVSGVDPGLVGIAPLPLGPTGKRGSEFNSRLYGINATIKDKKVRDAAWEFIRFLNSDEALRIKTKVFVENGYAKYISPKYLKEFGYDEYLKEVPDGWEEVVEETLTTGKPEPYGKNCNLIYYEMSPAVETVAISDTVNAKQVLDKAVIRTNEKLLGILTPEEKNKRQKVTFIVLSLIAVIFIFVFYEVFTTFSDIYRSKFKMKTKKYIFAYLIILPALLAVAIWSYYPLFKGSLMAFQEYKILFPAKWVGLDNFEEMLFTPRFWKSLFNSFYYTILFLGLGFASPILLAIMLHEIPKCKILYRTLYYLPAVTTGLVIMFLWRGFFDPSPQGLFNKVINIFGLSPQSWLNDPKLAMLCVIIPVIWAGMGPGCIVYLAALKSIPEELYEAADLDGASIWQKVTNVTFSQLKTLIIINFIGAFIGAMKSFDYIFAMTGGGPLDATHVLGLEIWYSSFLYLKFGYAIAIAWLLGALLVGFTVYNLRILSRVQFTTVK